MSTHGPTHGPDPILDAEAQSRMRQDIPKRAVDALIGRSDTIRLVPKGETDEKIEGIKHLFSHGGNVRIPATEDTAESVIRVDKDNAEMIARKVITERLHVSFEPTHDVQAETLIRATGKGTITGTTVDGKKSATFSPRAYEEAAKEHEQLVAADDKEAIRASASSLWTHVAAVAAFAGADTVPDKPLPQQDFHRHDPAFGLMGMRAALDDQAAEAEGKPAASPPWIRDYNAYRVWTPGSTVDQTEGEPISPEKRPDIIVEAFEEDGAKKSVRIVGGDPTPTAASAPEAGPDPALESAAATDAERAKTDKALEAFAAKEGIVLDPATARTEAIEAEPVAPEPAAPAPAPTRAAPATSLGETEVVEESAPASPEAQPARVPTSVHRISGERDLLAEMTAPRADTGPIVLTDEAFDAPVALSEEGERKLEAARRNSAHVDGPRDALERNADELSKEIRGSHPEVAEEVVALGANSGQERHDRAFTALAKTPAEPQVREDLDDLLVDAVKHGRVAMGTVKITMEDPQTQEAAPHLVERLREEFGGEIDASTKRDALFGDPGVADHTRRLMDTNSDHRGGGMLSVEERDVLTSAKENPDNRGAAMLIAAERGFTPLVDDYRKEPTITPETIAEADALLARDGAISWH